MPTYVYRGLESGEVFEVEQRMTEAPLTHNPTTGEPVSRVIQATGIVFKGSGFYKTDSRGSSGNSAAKPETDTPKAASPEPKAAASSDTAPASSESKAASPPEPKASAPSSKPE